MSNNKGRGGRNLNCKHGVWVDAECHQCQEEIAIEQENESKPIVTTEPMSDNKELLENLETALGLGNESFCFTSTALLLQCQNKIVDQEHALNSHDANKVVISRELAQECENALHDSGRHNLPLAVKIRSAIELSTALLKSKG